MPKLATSPQLKRNGHPKRGDKILILLGVCWLLFGLFLLNKHLNTPPSVTIEWETESEFETAGFNLYRSDTPTGEYQQVNQQLIPSQGDASSGAVYAYRDEGVNAGKSYYYRLEDVEYSNQRTMHPPFEYKLSSLDRFARPFLAYIGLFIGIGLIALGGYGFWLSRPARVIKPVQNKVCH